VSEPLKISVNPLLTTMTSSWVLVNFESYHNLSWF